MPVVGNQSHYGYFISKQRTKTSEIKSHCQSATSLAAKTYPAGSPSRCSFDTFRKFLKPFKFSDGAEHRGVQIFVALLANDF